MIDSNNQFNKLSRGLVDAVRGIMEAKGGTAPKSEKEKDLAAKAPPHDKITHADVLVGRGVLKKHPVHGKLVVAKEEAEEVDEATLSAKAARAGKDIGKPGKAFAKIAKTAGEKYGSKEAGMRVAGAVLAKMRAKNEEVEVEGEQIDEAMNAADRFQQHHQTAKDLLKSISQHLSAHADAAKNAKDYKGKKGPNWSHVGTMEHVAQQLGGIHDMLARTGEYTMNESVELDEAPVDGVAAGSLPNDGHLCATKVMHKEWAEGTPIHSQHAEPDADGNIAWYDVMFEHGIEKRVMVEDLEILMAETHERHGKRKMREEVEDLEELSTSTLKSYRTKARAQGNAIVDKMKMGGGDWSKDQKDTKTLTKRAAGANMSGKKLVKRGESLKTEDLELDEARGRPRKNPLPAGQAEEPEPRQHIIQQLQRAKLSMRGGEHITFKDGTKHHVSGEHAAKILAKYSGMRPAQKEDFQKKIGSSHSAFKEEL